MAENTSIEWADHTFNPWVGCTKISPACDHCYAESWAKRSGSVQWGGERRRTTAANWRLPLKWNAQAEREGRRYRVFCASLADVFDNQVPPEWREDLFALIESTPHLDWLLLTKRIGNADQMMFLARGGHLPVLPNVWIGATICNQDEAYRDIPKLLAVPAAVRFLSVEPMLGPVDLDSFLWRKATPTDWMGDSPDSTEANLGQALVRIIGIDWVIVGGESGPGARPMHPDWARSLRDQCTAAGVPFMFKQWGEWWEVDSDSRDEDTGDHYVVDVPSIEAFERFDPKTDCLIARDGRVFKRLDGLPLDIPCRHMTRLGKRAAGRLLDGVTHDGFPREAP